MASKEVCRPNVPQPQRLAPGWRGHSARTTHDLAAVLDEVVVAVEAAGYPRKDVFGIRLALEEAVVNALKHGHRGDPNKEVRVRYQVTPACALLEVEDEGEGFDPEAVPDPLAPENCDHDCGRGLLLMRSYMTWVRYNARGTCVTLYKCRAGAG